MMTLKFWEECRERRLEQLIKHQQSADDLLKRIQKPAHSRDDEDFERWNREIRIYWDQCEWIKEAERKLEHAENMVRMLGREICQNSESRTTTSSVAKV